VAAFLPRLFRRRFVTVGAAVCAAAISTAHPFGIARAQTPAPSASELDAYRLGQSYVRSFEDYLQPNTCGIVLERQRCRDDFAMVRAFATRKIDDQVARWLVDGDREQRIHDWDGLLIPDATWQRDPAFGWWYETGVLAIAADMPPAFVSTGYTSSIVNNMLKHADAAPAPYRGLIDSSDPEPIRIRHLLDAVYAALPPLAFPAVPDGADVAGCARLGVMNATLQQLIDNPLTLSRPESRRFALAVLDADEAFDRKLGGKDSFDALRARFRGEIPVDRRRIDVDFREPLVQWTGQLKSDPAKRDAFFTGLMSAQVAYNAAILKDEEADQQFRYVISQTAMAYAGMPADADVAISKMQSIPYAPRGSWSEINAAASAATLAIMGT
jgi:hypothetical protein